MSEEWIKSGLDFVDMEEEIEVTREDLTAAIEHLGGPQLSHRATDNQVLATFRQYVRPPLHTIEQIDAALQKPLSITRRAELVQRRLDLMNAAREASKYVPVGDLIVNAPTNISCIAGVRTNVATIYAEFVDGRRVFRLFRSEFDRLASSNGAWRAANPELT